MSILLIKCKLFDCGILSYHWKKNQKRKDNDDKRSNCWRGSHRGNFSGVGPRLIEDHNCNSSLTWLEGQLVVNTCYNLAIGGDKGAKCLSILLEIILLGEVHNWSQVSIIGADRGPTSCWLASCWGRSSCCLGSFSCWCCWCCWWGGGHGGNFSGIGPRLVEDNNCNSTLSWFEGQLVVIASYKLSVGRDEGAEFKSILLEIVLLGKIHNWSQVGIIGVDGGPSSGQSWLRVLDLVGEGN